MAATAAINFERRQIPAAMIRGHREPKRRTFPEPEFSPRIATVQIAMQFA